VGFPRCGGRRKPNIVYFGENVPKAHVEQGYSMVDGAEASSLTDALARISSNRGAAGAGCVVAEVQ
jgi:hypothetical protein